MVKLEKMMKKDTIGYWSAFGGIEVKEYEYGIDDYIHCICNAWHGTKTAHRVKVYESLIKGSYIKLYGIRFYLNECIACR